MQTQLLTESDLSLTPPAIEKMAELYQQVEDDIEGIRVFATPGGCSGMSFGLNFTDQLNDEDSLRDYDSFKIIVDDATLEHLRGVEIDFVDGADDGRFVFNNLPVSETGGCGSCPSQGGCG